MRWDRFFEDLEDQLASEWEAERAVLDTEAERLRLSRVALRERLAALTLADTAAPPPVLDLVDGTSVSGAITAVGADWCAVSMGDARAGATIVPLAAVSVIGLGHADVLRSARPDEQPAKARLAERMTLGFVLRDLVRRRVPVRVHLVGGRTLDGTIDRAGADHLDLALHEPGTPRRAAEVTGYRLVPFTAVAGVRVDATVPLI